MPALVVASARKPMRGENARRADVPRVGDDEGARLLVQRAERRALCAHLGGSRRSQPFMNAAKASLKSGCQRDSAGRFSTMSPTAQRMRLASISVVVSLSRHMT